MWRNSSNKKEGNHSGIVPPRQAFQALQEEGKGYTDGKQSKDSQKYVNIQNQRF